MKRHSTPSRIISFGLVLAALNLAATAGFVRNPSFESNYNDTFPHYGPIDEWTGGSGVNEAGGPFHNGGTPIPDGLRVAFAQGSANLSQEITGLTPGKSYWIQFHYDARGCCGGTIDLVTRFNDVELDRIGNVRPATGGKPYYTRSVAFTPDSDTGTLTFSTIAQGDATVVLDAVSIEQRDAGNVTILNPSFEASGDVLDIGMVSPASIGGWTGVGQYGVNISGLGPFADNGTAPDQDHVAFVQGLGSLSQVVNNLVIGKPYQLTVAYNARAGNSPHLQIKVGGAVLFEEDVAAVGAANPYRTRSVTFTAADLSAEIAIEQSKDGDHTLLLDDIRMTGDVQVPLPPLRMSPTAVEVGPGQKQLVTVTVPVELLAAKAVVLTFRSPAPAIARLVNADADGVLALSFDKAGANVKTFEVEAVDRGVARIEVVDSAGLTVADDVTVNVVSSFIRNSSFESSAVPGGVGYGPILAWTGGSGLNGAAGPFHDNGVIPDRRQIGFLQGAQTLSQQIVGLRPGQSYWLQFFYNARAAGGTTIDLKVRFDGQELASIPGIAAVGEQNPYNFANVPFTPGAGSGLLEFVTVPTGDATLLLDGLSIVQRGADDVVIRNPGFEASGSPSGVGYVQPDALAGWEATGGGRGININGVGPFTDNGLSSDQDRAAFLQGTGTALSQNLSGLAAGQKYTLIYEVNIRNCCSGTPATYRVSFADEVLLEEEITPVGARNPYHARYVVFTAAVTEGALKFEHTSEGDRSLLLDGIRVVKGEISAPVPQPMLRVAAQAGGIRISWPAADFAFNLQVTSALPAGWSNSTAAVIVEGDENVVTIVPNGTAQFFRLAQ